MIRTSDAFVEIAARALCAADNDNPDRVTMWGRTEKIGEFTIPLRRAWEKYSDAARSVVAAITATPPADATREAVEFVRQFAAIGEDAERLDMWADKANAIMAKLEPPK